MAAPASDPLSQAVLRLDDLPADQPTPFALTPKGDALSALGAELELLALRKVRFEGKLTPEGKHDWHLKARLGATVVQPCSVTLEPVTTRIDTEIHRRYLADFQAPTEGEVEMPEDDSEEPLPEKIDLNMVLAEELALALPPFPRAPGAELGESVFAPPGAEPLRDEEIKPFAGLADLYAFLERETALANKDGYSTPECGQGDA